MRAVKFSLTVIIALLVTTPCLFSISNTFIDARVSTYNAHFVVGTGDGRKLLYGFPNSIWSSKTTVRADSFNYIYGNDGTVTELPHDVGNTINHSAFSVNNMDVRQILSIVNNQRTNRNPDTIKIQYIVKNNDTINHDLGLRVQLDTQLGTNDESPIMVQNYGRVLNDTQWVGDPMPEAWQTLDDYYNPQLKAEGGINYGTATKPDRLIVGLWARMDAVGNEWTYTLNPAAITDTAVAIFWDPVTYTPGQQRSFTTYYGLPDSSGAELDLVKSVDLAGAEYGNTLSYTLTYSNTGTGTLGGCFIWDTLPWNTTFLDASAGYVYDSVQRLIYWNVGDISTPNVPENKWFRVIINMYQGTEVRNQAQTQYTDSYWNDLEVRNSNEVITIITQTPTASPTVTFTQTITVTLTATPTPIPFEFEHKGPFPNPSIDKANVGFWLSKNAEVDLIIYTVSGEVVNKISGNFTRGNNVIPWECKNEAGNKVAAGVYIYSIEAVTESKERKRFFGKIGVIK